MHQGFFVEMYVMDGLRVETDWWQDNVLKPEFFASLSENICKIREITIKLKEGLK